LIERPAVALVRPLLLQRTVGQDVPVQVLGVLGRRPVGDVSTPAAYTPAWWAVAFPEPVVR
jgi:hypothetical protein